MSQTAAEIKTEIANRLNRSDEISDAQIYNWMNRVKRKVCLRGSPMDFMARELMVLAGSGFGVPGDLDTFDNDRVVLPWNFAAPIRGIVLSSSDAMLTSAQAELIYGATAPVEPLFYFPSFTTEGSTGYTGDATGATIYPYFTSDTSFIPGELADRGISKTAAELFTDFVSYLEGSASTGAHEVVFFSSEQSRAKAKLQTSQVGAWITNYNCPAYDDIVAAINPGTATPQHALAPWTGKAINFEPGTWATAVGEGKFPLIYLRYWGVPPDYNEFNVETRQGTSVPVEDIFTRTAEDLLIFGALELAYLYLDDDARAARYAQRAAVEEAGFRKQHLITQVEAAGRPIRLRQGRKVTGI